MTQHLTDLPADGTSFGQNAADKISFYGNTPVAQASGANQAAITAGATTTAANTLLIDIRTALVNLGLIKGSS